MIHRLQATSRQKPLRNGTDVLGADVDSAPWQRSYALASVYTEAAVLSEIARAQILQAEICELQHYFVLDVCKISSRYHWIFVVSFGRFILNKNVFFTVKS